MTEKTFGPRRLKTSPMNTPIYPDKELKTFDEVAPVDSMAFLDFPPIDTSSVSIPDDLVPPPIPVPASLYDNLAYPPSPNGGPVVLGQVPEGMTPEQFKKAFTMATESVNREPNRYVNPPPPPTTPPMPINALGERYPSKTTEPTPTKHPASVPEASLFPKPETRVKREVPNNFQAANGLRTIENALSGPKTTPTQHRIAKVGIALLAAFLTAMEDVE